MANFAEVWEKIKNFEGQEFETITGITFTYKIKKYVLIPSRPKYNLSKANFEKAYELWPITGPGKISRIVRGSSYVWAILKRII